MNNSAITHNFYDSAKTGEIGKTSLTSGRRHDTTQNIADFYTKRGKN